MRYIHYKNGKIYKTIDKCCLQDNQEWKERIIYTEEGGDKLFVRSLKENEVEIRVEELNNKNNVRTSIK
jgi:hypothetical protein